MQQHPGEQILVNYKPEPDIIQGFGKELQEAIEQQAGRLTDFEPGTPEHTMLDRNLKQAWEFAGAKAFDVSATIAGNAVDGHGLKPLKEVERLGEKIAEKHSGLLKTEKVTAAASAAMAAKWVQIQKDKGLFPLLQFDAVNDAHTTATCASLDGVIKPVDDAFWVTYYPPNHYNCRSTVRQLPLGTPTPDEDIRYPSIPEQFQVNLADRGQLFPADHSYFKAIDAEGAAAAQGIKNANRQSAPYDQQFDEVEGTHGRVREHFMTEKKKDDYARNILIAVEKAKTGHFVDIMPNLSLDEYGQEFRDIIFAEAKYGKSPDLRINGIFWEEEGVHVSKDSTISRRIKNGFVQSDNIIINLLFDNRLPIDLLERTAKGRFHTHAGLHAVEYWQNGKIVKAYIRDDFD